MERGYDGMQQTPAVHTRHQRSSRKLDRRVSNSRWEASQSEQLASAVAELGMQKIYHQAHSRAPFLYSHKYPTSRMPRNTIIETRANSPKRAATHPLYRIAQGMRNIVSTSKITNSMAKM